MDGRQLWIIHYVVYVYMFAIICLSLYTITSDTLLLSIIRAHQTTLKLLQKPEKKHIMV